MLLKLRNRLNVKNNLQLAIILLVFTIAGSSTVIAREAIFGWIGVTAETSLIIKIPLYILVIFPLYQALFLLTGTLLGQIRFAWEFEKKMISRFKIKK
jgi:manganese efflux pump family protein